MLDFHLDNLHRLLEPFLRDIFLSSAFMHFRGNTSTSSTVSFFMLFGRIASVQFFGFLFTFSLALFRLLPFEGGEPEFADMPSHHSVDFVARAAFRTWISREPAFFLSFTRRVSND